MAASVLLRHGLTDAEAEARLGRYGPNVLPRAGTRGLVAVARSTLREPVFLLLILAAGLYLVLGDLAEGLFLLGGATLSLGLVIVQELRSERALAALNALAEPVALVIRGGRRLSLPASLLVPGDLLVVAEGGRLPADAILVDGDVLLVDESALTGESVPVDKRPGSTPARDCADPVPGEAVTGHLFAGTMIVRGQGLAQVERTGATTQLGRIGAALGSLVEEPTPLQRSIGRLITRLGIAAIAFCLLLAATYGWLRGDWFQGALAGITLAIALLPEEFPMVLAVFMALGAWRLAKHNVLVRRSAVIETLGATTLLCVDKTGTLTENRMTLHSVWRDGRTYELDGAAPPEAAAVIAAARLACSVHPHDPMDSAVHEMTGPPAGAAPLRSYPVGHGFPAFVQVWPEADGGALYAAKGAPETLLSLCRLDDASARAAAEAVRMLGERGIRVLAVAEARFGSDPAADPSAVQYGFLGLLGFNDPPRADVPAAIEEARRAGIGVAMITGDYPATALAIARMVGIDARTVVSGTEIAGGSGISGKVDEARVFARIMPDQKLRLVEAFRAAGHVVAMTGDGINDAPALAAAHVGIAMGLRGTDVAREASDLILLDDRFASIVGGIRQGRRIFANLRRAMTFIAAIHVPIAGLALLPILLGLPPLFFPAHVVLLELLLDPLCSLVFESERGDKDAMSRPPRPAAEPLFGARQILLAGVQGTILLAVTLGLYWWFIATGAPETIARTAAFCALVAGNLSLALVEARGRGTALFDRRRKIFWAIGGAYIAILALCLALPPLARLLQLSPLPPATLLLVLAAGIAGGGWFALVPRWVGDPAARG